MSVRTCERCGAVLPAVPPGAAVLCAYCGAQNTAPAAPGVLQIGNVQIRVPANPMTVEQIQEGFRERAQVERERLRRARILAAVFAGVVLVALAVVMLLVR